MPITNYIPSSRLIQPGVCTSSTRPASPFEGQCIYETDTDMMAIWNGTAWRYIAATTPTNGTVLQVVEGTTTTTASSTSTTYTDSNLSATITPRSSSSKIFVFSIQAIYASSSVTGANLRLLRGSTVLDTRLDVNYGTNSGVNTETPFIYFDSPATTSATTYKMQLARNGGAGIVYAQTNSTKSSIILMEIAG